MKTINEWLTAYGRDHKNPTNIKIHKVCVPLILLSILGILWSIPTPSFFSLTHPFPLNFSTFFAIGALLFYLKLDRAFFLIMTLVAVFCFILIHFWSQNPYFLETNVAIFVLAWIGQFIGHKIEGQKPSFLEDIQFLLIGPLWVIKDLRSLFIRS